MPRPPAATQPLAESPSRASWLPVAAAGVAAGMVLWVLASEGIGADGLRSATRLLARLGFPLFLAAFTASALATLAPSRATAWLLRSRRSVGLAFACVQLAHLAALVVFYRAGVGRLEASAQTIAGGLGFAVVIAMAATSNDAAVRALGRERWSRFHRAGIHYLWFVFAFTYGVLSAGDPSYLPGVAAALAALGLRIAARRHRRAGAVTAEGLDGARERRG